MLGTNSGPGKLVQQVLLLENVTLRGRRARYEVRPDDLLQAQKLAEKEGLVLSGVYHSHPDGDTSFSHTDLENSCPWYSFVVLSIRGGRFDSAAAWLPNAGQTSAEKEELIYPQQTQLRGD